MKTLLFQIEQKELIIDSSEEFNIEDIATRMLEQLDFDELRSMVVAFDEIITYDTHNYRCTLALRPYPECSLRVETPILNRKSDKDVLVKCIVQLISKKALFHSIFIIERTEDNNRKILFR